VKGNSPVVSRSDTENHGAKASIDRGYDERTEGISRYRSQQGFVDVEETDEGTVLWLRRPTADAEDRLCIDSVAKSATVFWATIPWKINSKTLRTAYNLEKWARFHAPQTKTWVLSSRIKEGISPAILLLRDALHAVLPISKFPDDSRLVANGCVARPIIRSDLKLKKAKGLRPLA